MPVTVVLGAQWGDEGKGKLVDILSQQSDLCARCAGGNNAGHTIVVPLGPNNKTTPLDFHLLPCGLVNPECVALIGSGVVVHLPSFFAELEKIEATVGLNCQGRLLLSDRAHLVFDFHQIVDGLKEAELGGKPIGTTRKGIGPAYSSKASRSGLRVHHLFDDDFADKFRKIVEGRFKRYGHFEYDTEKEIERYKGLAERLRPYVVDAVSYMSNSLNQNKRILVEGANALMLDIDYGTYPFVTSSNTAIGGVCTGLAIPPKKIDQIIGVVKAYTTRVGGGPFPTEQLNEIGEKLQRDGHEEGTTTGRPRRCGWLDLVVLKYSHSINGYDLLNLTKLDILTGMEKIKVAVKYKIGDEELEGFPADLERLSRVSVEYATLGGWKSDISKVTTYEELPDNCREYVQYIESFLGVKIGWIGVGPGRESMITR